MNISEDFNYQPIKTAIISLIIFFISIVAAVNSKAAGLLIADGGFGGVLEIKEHVVHKQQQYVLEEDPLTLQQQKNGMARVGRKLMI